MTCCDDNNDSDHKHDSDLLTMLTTLRDNGYDDGVGDDDGDDNENEGDRHRISSPALADLSCTRAHACKRREGKGREEERREGKGS